MSRGPPDRRSGSRIDWLPPLLVGAAAAVAAEVGISVLLYGGPGLLRSLTTVLAVESLAFGAGLATAPAGGDDVVDRLRRRWLVCLIGFLAAALYGTAWSIFPWLGSGRVGQGFGLAVLGGLPMYTAAVVLGGMSAVARTDPGGRLRPPGPGAAAGAALGFVATGLLLPRAPMPASLLVACLVMLSLAGMMYGVVLGSRTEVNLRARRPGPGGDVRVEDRRRSRDELAVRVLLHGANERRAIPLDRGGPIPWDVAVARELMPSLDSPWRVLVLGGGASWAPRSILREHPTAIVDVVERVGAVVELGREYLNTELSTEGADRVRVFVGNLDDAVAKLTGPYDLIVVDGNALTGFGGETALSASSRARLHELLSAGGTIAWGPVASGASPPEAAEGWTRRDLVEGLADSVALYRPSPAESTEGEPSEVLAR